MANRVLPITVTPVDRAELERLQRASSTPAGLSRRARAVLLMAQGESGVAIAERIGYTVVQVSRIRRRYAEGGVAGLHDRPKSGRPPGITARQRAHIVALTLKEHRRHKGPYRNPPPSLSFLPSSPQRQDWSATSSSS
jgi:DNA-binding CsgD family transcriptional regulator